MNDTTPTDTTEDDIQPKDPEEGLIAEEGEDAPEKPVYADPLEEGN